MYTGVFIKYVYKRILAYYFASEILLIRRTHHSHLQGVAGSALTDSRCHAIVITSDLRASRAALFPLIMLTYISVNRMQRWYLRWLPFDIVSGQQGYDSSKQHDVGATRFARLNTIRPARHNRPSKVVVRDACSTVVGKIPADVSRG